MLIDQDVSEHLVPDNESFAVSPDRCDCQIYLLYRNNLSFHSGEVDIKVKISKTCKQLDCDVVFLRYDLHERDNAVPLAIAFSNSIIVVSHSKLLTHACSTEGIYFNFG
jgi:hypothetical protein